MLMRTQKMATEVIKFSRIINNSDESYIIKKQMIRSATSVAANYRSVCRARSNNEFYAKLCIVVEEIDETNLWLELIKDTDLSSDQALTLLLKETSELTSILARSKSTYRSRYIN
ncbi:MAG: four helix bundle protein [Bacteroidetes bacterium]|nr:four helix bundle protein [Bacteroidota bacterium]